MLRWLFRWSICLVDMIEVILFEIYKYNGKKSENENEVFL